MKHKVVLIACLIVLLCSASVFAARIEGGIAYSSAPIVDPELAYGYNTSVNGALYGHLQSGILEMALFTGADLVDSSNSHFEKEEIFGYDFKGIWAVPMVGLGFNIKSFEDVSLRISAMVGPDVRIKTDMCMNSKNVNNMIDNSKLHYQANVGIYLNKLPLALNVFVMTESQGNIRNLAHLKQWNKLAFSDCMIFGLGCSLVLN